MISQKETSVFAVNRYLNEIQDDGSKKRTSFESWITIAVTQSTYIK